MDWILYVLTALWAVACALELYVLVKKHKSDKANYRFVVCEQRGKSLVPVDTFDCESDARQHYAFYANKIIIRVSELDLRRYEKHVSD